MKENQLVSVVVPLYNAEKYINETIESILNQTYSLLEIIIVNDGSTDNSELALQKYLHLENVKYIKIQNSGGPSIPRNIGIENSRGDCIFIFDADDLMYPEKIEETLRVSNLQKNQAIGLYFTNFIRIDEDSKMIDSPFLDKYQDFNQGRKEDIGTNCYKIEKETAFDILIKDCFIGTSSVMLPKKTVMDGFRFDEKMKNGDDLDLWLRISLKYDLGFVDKVLHGYRIHGGGLFGTASSKRIIQRANILQKYAPFIKNTTTKKAVNNKIMKTLYSAGYYHQNKGEYHKAMTIYSSAFLKYPKYILLRGIIVSLLKQFKSQWKI